MPRILRRKSDGSVIPDFQGDPSPGTLTNNALQAGIITSADEVEEVDVDQITYDAEVQKLVDATKSARDAVEAADLAERQSILDKIKTAAGLTIKEADRLKEILGLHDQSQ